MLGNLFLPRIYLSAAILILTGTLFLGDSRNPSPIEPTNLPIAVPTDDESGGKQMTAAASAFLATLNEAEFAKAVFDYDSPQRTGWHFIPKDSRKGMQVRNMSEKQRLAADQLLRASLSLAGYNKAQEIMELESLLKAVEKGKGAVRDPERYYYCIFGKPGVDRWGLSIEGHHLSLNFVVEDHKLVSVTPSFFAANPAIVKTDLLKSVPRGTRVLADEEQLGFALVNSLNGTQKEVAVFAERAPREIRAAGEPQPPTEKPIGIRGSKLNDSQMAILKKLVQAYAANFPGKVGQQKIKQIAKNGWGNLSFAWGGATEPGIGHYYRVEGKSVLIEFVNTQPDALGNPANHIHCVWRNPTGDFALEIKR